MVAPYTYVAVEPEIYDGKRFKVTMDGEGGETFLMSVATDASELDRLVELATKPVVPAVYENPQNYPSADEQIKEMKKRIEALEALLATK